jgi:hypothetical protein
LFVGDDAGSYAARGLPGEFAMLSLLSFYHPGLLDVEYPDLLKPIGGSEAIMEYEGGGTAAIFYDGSYRVINLGFPLETIDNAADRAILLGMVMDAFELSPL